jgi:hypothetical protein
VTPTALHSRAKLFLYSCVFTLLLYLSGLFVVFSALPLVYATLKSNRRLGIYLSVVTFVLLAFLYQFLLPNLSGDQASTWTSALLTLPGIGLYEKYGASVVLGMGSLYFFFYLSLGWTMIWLARQKFKVERFFGALVGVPLLVSIGIVFVFSVYFQFDIFVETKNYLLYIQDKMISLDQGSGLSPEELVFLKQFGKDLVATIAFVLPALIVNMTLFVVWFNIFVARRWMGGALPYKSLGNLSRWRIQDSWIWVLIGSAASVFVNLYVLKSTIVGFVASNTLIFVLCIYFLHGLSIVAYYLQKKRTLFVRFSVYFAIFVFFQFAVILITVLGVFDFWADFRKLQKTAKTKVKEKE